MPYPIPLTFEAWLAGWRTASRTGNPYLRLPNGDTFVIWPQTTPPGFRGRVGRSVVDRRWPTVEAAKAGLYDLVVKLTPAELAALHGPPEPRREPDRREPDRRPDRSEWAGTPPVDEGMLLGSCPRNDGQEELRITLKTYESRPYVAVRVWFCDRNGNWWPTRKGCSIRLREAGRVVEALEKALAVPHRQAAAPAAAAAPRPGDGGAAGRGGWAHLGGARPARAEFDEFGDGADDGN
jgi:hypothetical protein